jgi:predicted ATP-grasp superfamily ATP-dependent carboligase
MADRFREHDALVRGVREATFDRPPALVANAHITGLGVARALSAADVPVIAVDQSVDGVAPYSAAVDLAGRVTYPLDDLAGYREDVEAIAAACDREPVAFGCMDEWVHALVDARPDGVRLSFAADRVDGVLDKERLYARADRLGVPHPETYRIEETVTDESNGAPPVLPAADVASRLEFPLILKPALKRRFEAVFGTNVVEASEREAYREVVDDAREAGIRLLAQARVDKEVGEDRSLAAYVPPGDGDDAGGDAAAAAPDSALAVVGNAAVRYPRGYGTSCVVHETAGETVRERALAVLGDAGYHGISEAEFVYDRERETHVLLDVNTRPWKWIAMPVAAGRNLPLAAYADATDADTDIDRAQARAEGPDPVTWVYLRDYLALLAGVGTDGGATAADRQALEPDHWRSLVAGRVSERRDLTTGVYRPADPEPTYRLIESEVAGREYYCAC